MNIFQKTFINPLLVCVIFNGREKKFFELDALIGNTFKENSELLGRKALKQMN